MEKKILHTVGFSVLHPNVMTELRYRFKVVDSLAEYLADLSLLSIDIRVKYDST